MKVKYYFSTVCGIVSGGIVAALGGFDDILNALFVCMVIDLLLGVLCGIEGVSEKSKGGHITSSAFVKGLFKKITELCVVALGVQLDVVLGTEFVRSAAICGFICSEIISLFENSGKLGVPMPDVIKKALDTLNTKAGENNDIE